MWIVFPGRARWRARLGAVALACAWPLASPATAELPSAALPNAEPLDWRLANDTVGRFLRGHIDLLKTEPEVAPPPPASGTPLTLDQALSLALSRRPDLFDRPGLAPSERLAQRREALALRLRVQALWSRAVLAASQARLSEEAAAAAQTGAELGRRMAQVGNWSRAQWQQEHAAWLDAQMAHDQARQQASAAREALVRELALTGTAAQIRLPDSLPPATPLPRLDSNPDKALATLQTQASQNHPAVAQARAEAQWQAQATSPTHLTQVRAALAQAAEQATRAGAAQAALNPAELAWSHSLERALTAEHQAQAQEAALQSQVRQAWQQLQLSQQRTTQLSQLLTLQTELLADMQRRYNGMLKSTWDLLATARERLAVEQRLQQAQQQQWLAQAALNHLLAGGDAAGIETESADAGTSPRRSPGH
ncbi:MAG: TolC family protein [Hydrogenophaga sp.]|nr:TolC family protein [Hydrogenophaga sp.]